MLKIRNNVVFRVVQTPDGYDVYRMYDGKNFDLVEEGLATLDDVQKLIEEEA